MNRTTFPRRISRHSSRWLLFAAAFVGGALPSACTSNPAVDSGPDANGDTSARPDVITADAHDVTVTDIITVDTGAMDQVSPTDVRIDVGAETGLDATVEAGSRDAAADVAVDVPIGPSGRIEGYVRQRLATSTFPMRGATVRVNGTSLVTTSDGDGRFVFAVAPAGDRVRVDVEASRDDQSGAGWTTTQRIVRVPVGGVGRTVATLVPSCVATAPMSPTAPASSALCNLYRGQLSFGFAGGSIVNASGAPYTGTMRIELAVVPRDPANNGRLTTSFDGLPGEMTARRTDGSRADLISLGAAEIRLNDSITNERLQVAPGRTVQIRMRALPRPATEDVRSWRYDESLGDWVEEGAGRWEGLDYVIDAGHLSWWNADYAQDATSTAARGCITGTLLQPDGSPAVNATITASGISYARSISATTDATGRFCVIARTNADVLLEAHDASARPVQRLAVEVHTISTGAGMCPAVGPGTCTDVGVIGGVDPDAGTDAGTGAWNPVVPGCVRGRVIFDPRDGMAMTSGQYSLSVRAGTNINLGPILTADGSFCTALPGSFPIDIVDLNPMGGCRRLGVTATPGPFGFGDASNSCGGGGCQDLGDLTAFCMLS